MNDRAFTLSYRRIHETVSSCQKTFSTSKHHQLIEMKVTTCVCVYVSSCRLQISSSVIRQKASHLTAGTHTQTTSCRSLTIKTKASCWMDQIPLLPLLLRVICWLQVHRDVSVCSGWRLAVAGTTLVGEHLLSIASCPPSLLLVELAPAVATEQDGDANETEDSS